MREEEVFILVGHKIRRVRQLKSISQQDLAAMLNIEKSNMARIESGRTNITIRNLYRIAISLGVPLSELMEGIPL